MEQNTIIFISIVLIVVLAASITVPIIKLIDHYIPMIPKKAQNLDICRAYLDENNSIIVEHYQNHS